MDILFCIDNDKSRANLTVGKSYETTRGGTYDNGDTVMVVDDYGEQHELYRSRFVDNIKWNKIVESTIHYRRDNILKELIDDNT